MTTEEIKKTVGQMIDSLESMHEELLAYGQESVGTDQTDVSSSFRNGGSAKERAACDTFTER
jgi:hypothetical protein